MKPKIIATEKRDGGNSYLIKFNKNMQLWFDTWRLDDGELVGDWNKYIFFTKDEQDMREQAFQKDSNNFEIAIELCRDEEAE